MELPAIPDNAPLPDSAGRTSSELVTGFGKLPNELFDRILGHLLFFEQILLLRLLREEFGTYKAIHSFLGFIGSPICNNNEIMRKMLATTAFRAVERAPKLIPQDGVSGVKNPNNLGYRKLLEQAKQRGDWREVANIEKNRKDQRKDHRLQANFHTRELLQGRDRPSEASKSSLGVSKTDRRSYATLLKDHSEDKDRSNAIEKARQQDEEMRLAPKAEQWMALFESMTEDMRALTHTCRGCLGFNLVYTWPCCDLPFLPGSIPSLCYKCFLVFYKQNTTDELELRAFGITLDYLLEDTDCGELGLNASKKAPRRIKKNDGKFLMDVYSRTKLSPQQQSEASQYIQRTDFRHLRFFSISTAVKQIRKQCCFARTGDCLDLTAEGLPPALMVNKKLREGYYLEVKSAEVSKTAFQSLADDFDFRIAAAVTNPTQWHREAVARFWLARI